MVCQRGAVGILPGTEVAAIGFLSIVLPKMRAEVDSLVESLGAEVTGMRSFSSMDFTVSLKDVSLVKCFIAVGALVNRLILVIPLMQLKLRGICEDAGTFPTVILGIRGSFEFRRLQ